MNYANNYLNATKIASTIRESATKGKTRSGLAARREQETPVEADFSINTYMKDMKKLFEGQEPKQQDFSVTGALVDMEAPTEQAPEKSPRPRGRSEIPQGEVPTYIYEGLVERGLPEHVAQGMLMNIKDESGFQESVEEYEPNVHGTRGKGLYQLTGDRREAFEEMYGDDYSVDNQLDFLMYELENTESSAFEDIMQTETPGEAGATIVREFLRPAEEYREERAARYINATPYTPRNVED